MKTLVPNRFLFDFEFALHFREKLPRLDGMPLDWTDADLLPDLSEFDGVNGFARVWACWNERGICIACKVEGKRKPLVCDAKKYKESDNLRLCIDTRDARTNKRATRFCQQFFFMPRGGGARRDRPVAGLGSFQRSRDDAQSVDVKKIEVGSCVGRDGYSLEAFVPGQCLVGFDPREHPRIGFYYMLEDSEHGQQYLTVGDDLQWYADPSTWATAVLGND